ncbi:MULTISPECIES: ABC transporter permease [unclassified Sporosarcina]|uniref:ABC transporter permease n=1 Tax=unclassified Sporosarcina TaxID=2647733 RepID=UPI00222ED32D|nr:MULTISPECIES: ABC transporter permease [unclassified Sporosarcina]
MYIAKRVITMLLTIWAIATLTFVIMKFIPGDPFASDSRALPEEVLQNVRAKYNLDKPIPIQYALYMKDMLVLDLGVSLNSETRTVNDIIKQGAPISAFIGLQAMVVASIFGIILGTVSALNHRRFIDYLATIIAIIGISIPNFILAPFLIKYFAVDIPLFPVARWGTWMHSVLPSIALAVAPLAIIARFMRSSMLDVLNQDYIMTANSKGLPTFKILWSHGIRNAILPVVSFIGPLFASLITGTFVIEQIFAIPGIGRYFVESVFNRDYPVIMGTTVFFSAVLVFILFIIDLSYRVIDPRIKLTSEGDGK